MTRTTPYNASLYRTLTKYRIEIKRNGRWTPVRSVKKMAEKEKRSFSQMIDLLLQKALTALK